MTDYFSSPSFPRHESPYGSPFRDDLSGSQSDVFFRGKRSRRPENDEYIAEHYQDDEGDDETAHSRASHLDKRSRKGPSSFSTTRHPSPFHVDRTTASLESEIESMREEFRAKYARQEEQLKQYADENAELTECNSGLRGDNQKLIDENRLLKKAVGIQETRFKESSSQNSRLREYLSQAANQIAALERTTSSLKSQLQRANTPNSVFPHMPPDVY